MLVLCFMLSSPYYAEDYARIINTGLALVCFVVQKWTPYIVLLCQSQLLSTQLASSYVTIYCNICISYIKTRLIAMGWCCYVCSLCTGAGQLAIWQLCTFGMSIELCSYLRAEGIVIALTYSEFLDNFCRFQALIKINETSVTCAQCCTSFSIVCQSRASMHQIGWYSYIQVLP